MDVHCLISKSLRSSTGVWFVWRRIFRRCHLTVSGQWQLGVVNNAYVLLSLHANYLSVLVSFKGLREIYIYVLAV